MSPQKAYQKCKKENRRISELEKNIATDPEYSYYYALQIIEGPFESGEDTISKDSEWSYKYAFYILDKQWELSEEAISKDPEYSYWYARNVIKGPFEKSHHIIFNSHHKNDYIDFLKSINYDLNKISEWLI